MLLEYGFEPNERIEFGNNLIPELDDVSGFTPIQLLAAIATDTQREKHLDSYMLEIIQQAAGVLLTAGARLNLAPAASRVRPRKISKLINETTESNRALREAILNQKGEYERGFPLVENDAVITCFGGKSLITDLQSYWSSMKYISWDSEYTKLSLQDSVETPDSPENGGNDEKSCAICWQEFGMFSYRSKQCNSSQKRGRCDFYLTNNDDLLFHSFIAII